MVRAINGRLVTAAENGSVDLVVALLDKIGADKNFKDTLGDTPLIKAASNGHLPVVETLLAAGADVAISGDLGWSALHRSTMRGFAGVAVALMDAGADKDVRCRSGLTPLMVAIYYNSVSVVKILLERRADVHVVDVGGRTPLYFAARIGRVEVVHALLRAGADANLGGTTPLMAAANKGHRCVMETLLAAGADVNIRSTKSEGCTALHFAALYHNVSAVSILLLWGADENARDDDDKTPADFNRKWEPPTQYVRDRVERVRLLLARAPADRAWRRRGWLVMLRSRTLKAGGDGGAAGTGEGTNGASGDGGASRERSVKQRGGDGGGGVDLSAAVEWLEGVEEGVFRNVVGFL